MSIKGFIKVDRDIDQHWIFQRDPEFRIWVYLILRSQFSNQKKPVMIGNTERTLQRGEFLTTIEKIAGDLNVKPRVVRRCLDLFKKNIPTKRKSKGNQKAIKRLSRVNIIITTIMGIMEIMKRQNIFINVRFIMKSLKNLTLLIC